MDASASTINKVLAHACHPTKNKAAKRPCLHINTQCIPCRPFGLHLSPRPCIRSISAALADDITTTGGGPNRRSIEACESASEILPWLYLGSARDAADMEKLSERNIHYIVNATKEVEGSPEFHAKGFQYLKLELDDTSDSPIAQYFEQTHQFIEDARERRAAVLVHCRRGISRSATLVIAYVMRHMNTTFEQAFEFVKQRRAIINPNLGFVLALESISPKSSPSAPDELRPSRRDDPSSSFFSLDLTSPNPARHHHHPSDSVSHSSSCGKSSTEYGDPFGVLPYDMADALAA